jgi:peptide/nickel transport system substrate-binding protein
MNKKLLNLLLVVVMLAVLVPTALAAPPAQEGQDYVIVADDWLSKLADKYLGNPFAYVAIVEYTNQKHAEDASYAEITDPDVIEVGWKVYIPSAEEVATAITGGAAPTPKELRIGIATEPWDLDPAIRTDTGSGYVIKNVYDPLIELDQNNEPTCHFALCEKWEIKNDAQTIVVYLRKGIKFHDGTDLTAADVKYNIDWQMDDENSAPNKGLLGPVESVNVIDDYTLEVNFTDPFTAALQQWSRALDGIVPEGGHGERSAEKGPAGFLMTELSRNPVGTGPFKFVDWVSGSNITVERFDGYWVDGVPAPGIDRVVFEFIGEPAAMEAALIAGAIHIVDKVPFRDYAAISQMPGIKTARIPGIQTEYVATNLGAPPFGISADQLGDEEAIERALNLRKFLYHAIDREEIAEEIFYGMATIQYGPWYPDSDWSSPNLLDRPLYDPELAKEYLDKAGPEYADGFSFRMICTDAQWFCDVSTIIQEQLRPYGVDVEVIPIDKAAFFDTLYESFDWETGMEDWGLNNFLAESWLWSGWYRNDHNHIHWHHADPDLPETYHETVPGHAEFSELWDKANIEPDEQKRKEMVWELEEMIVDDVLRVNLMFLDNLHAWRDSVEGYGDGLNSQGEINLKFVTAFTE